MFTIPPSEPWIKAMTKYNRERNQIPPIRILSLFWLQRPNLPIRNTTPNTTKGRRTANRTRRPLKINPLFTEKFR
jgi:hypothetical protein